MRNFKFKKIFGKVFNNRRKAYKTEEVNPRRDWKIIAIIFILTSFGIIVFDAYVYWIINKGGFFASSSKEAIPIESIDRSELAKVIKFYEDREKFFQEAKNKKPEIVDPSI